MRRNYSWRKKHPLRRIIAFLLLFAGRFYSFSLAATVVSAVELALVKKTTDSVIRQALDHLIDPGYDKIVGIGSN